jgi:hypothetical protein
MAGFRLSSSALSASFTYQLLEKRAFFVAALMDALNSLYIL